MSISTPGWRRVPEETLEKAFKAWIETGQLVKAERLLIEMGVRNSKGKPFPASQIAFLAHTYLLMRWKEKNLIEDINQDLYNMGLPPMKQEEFEEFLVKKALTLWAFSGHSDRFWKWIESNGFQKYDYLWKDFDIPAFVGAVGGRPPTRKVAARPVQA